MVGIVFIVCLSALLFGHPSTDEQRWLQSAITLILGAAVGAAFRKS
jgi:lipoprotein signal peptidase